MATIFHKVSNRFCKPHDTLLVPSDAVGDNFVAYLIIRVVTRALYIGDM